MTLSCILLALILDAFFGEPNWLWSKLQHPAVTFGKIITWGEKNITMALIVRVKALYF